MAASSILPLLAVAAVQTSVAGAAGPTPDPAAPPAWTDTAAFRADTILAPPEGPRIVLLGSPATGVAALRLFVPLTESAVEAGTGAVLRSLALERMETLARPVGAHVEAVRTPRGVAYQVEGARADFEYLAYLLRAAVAEPRPEPVALARALRELRLTVQRDLESPPDFLVARLRREVAPEVPPLHGTPATIDHVDPARLTEVWRRSHRAPAMTLVVVAAVTPEVVLAATRGMGAVGEGAAPPDAPAPHEPAPPRPETLRTWVGSAWRGGRPTDPRGPVAALLLADYVRRNTAGFESGVELRELPDSWVLVVRGAAYRPALPALRELVETAPSELRASLSDEAVREAAGTLRRTYLRDARTPGGLAATVGRAAELRGDPEEAARYVAAMRELTTASLAAFLDEILAEAPVRAEVRP